MTQQKLKPGDLHPRAYVGPPDQYDYMGATQFCLLAALGLRSKHHVLDFGCGSLRAGRLLLAYLQPGHYFGIDPNKWLIQSAISEDLGEELIKLRKPRFDYNAQFQFDVFDTRFDFIVLQSILSHTGADLLDLALSNAGSAMHEKTLLLVTVIHQEQASANMPSGKAVMGWNYPGCVWYSRDGFSQFAMAKGFFTQELPWHHPRQTWWLLSHSEANLLNQKALNRLSGFTVQNANHS